ncbi:MAG: hypothetical protein R3A11_04330 [Bdellovibrionota bacterium]
MNRASHRRWRWMMGLLLLIPWVAQADTLQLDQLHPPRFDVEDAIEIHVERQVRGSTLSSRCIYTKNISLVSTDQQKLFSKMFIKGAWQVGQLYTDDCERRTQIQNVQDQFWDQLATLTSADHSFVIVEGDQFFFSSDPNPKEF